MGAENQYNLAQAGNLTPEDYAQQQQLNRQQQMAQMLMQQSQQPQGQMISGRYVAPSWAQMLNPVANVLASKYIGEKADTEASKLAQKIREGKAGYEEQIIKQLSPQAAQTAGIVGPDGKMTMQTTADMYGPDMQLNPAYKKVEAQEARGPDYAAALKTIRTNPYGVGKEMMPEILKKQLGPEDTADYRNYLKVKAEYDAKGIPISFNQYQDMDANRKRPVTNVSVNTGQHGFDNTVKLGETFKSEPIYKAHQEVSQAYKQVNNALNRGDAAGDLAAAIKINKMFDPTGVVKESEAARIAAARGGLDTMLQLTAKITKGEDLTPMQRKQYKTLVKDFYDISGEQYNETRNKYSVIGKENKLSGVETMLGQPWKPSTSVVFKPTQNMQDANRILGIPSGD